MTIRNPVSKIKIGISSCLLGEKVRWDGNHKKDSVVKNQLGRIFEWVPTCPEVEIGMGIPREAVKLTGNSQSPSMVGTESGKNWTTRMSRYATERSRELTLQGVCGYILKSKSPSCGISGIPVVSNNGKIQRKGRGLFTDAILQQYPLIPVEDEGKLHNARVRENFITRVYAYYRLRNLLDGRFSRKTLVEFHNAHKYLLMSHSRKHHNHLEKLVANANQLSLSELKRPYAELFLQAFTYKTTIRKNSDAMHHMLGLLKPLLSEDEIQDVISAIDDYRNERVPRKVPITRIERFAQKYRLNNLVDQVYPSSIDKDV